MHCVLPLNSKLAVDPGILQHVPPEEENRATVTQSKTSTCRKINQPANSLSNSLKLRNLDPLPKKKKKNEKRKTKQIFDNKSSKSTHVLMKREITALREPCFNTTTNSLQNGFKNSRRLRETNCAKRQMDSARLIFTREPTGYGKAELFPFSWLLLLFPPLE